VSRVNGPRARRSLGVCTAARPRCAASCPELIDLIWNRQINPGKVFDLKLPLDQSAEGYRAMDERRAIKVLLRL
jgi:threonine dehydrogenase-like Zn-dependent dehydrogenase